MPLPIVLIFITRGKNKSTQQHIANQMVNLLQGPIPALLIINEMSHGHKAHAGSN